MIINKLDNVEIDPEDGHKYALCDIAAGENIIKYGNPIGHATCNIKKGEHVHSHNLVTNLKGKLEYEYDPEFTETEKKDSRKTFLGYKRKNGEVGIRNDIWIVNTVGCVNGISSKLSQKTGAFCFEHPFGCSQLGDDLKTTALVLRGIVNNPDAGGVLVLGLGCENNNIEVFKNVLGEYDPDRVKFLNAQDSADEIAEGTQKIAELQNYAAGFKRESIDISNLRIGLKCGGSDGYSGITANPLVGAFADKIISYGASCVMTEVPEMFGAEHLLMKRCVDRGTFDKTVSLVNDFKDYFIRHNQEVYENPSPGNKKGGITTLEEKSLGCVTKSGSSPVTDVLGYGDRVKKSGLSLLNGPGNDIVAMTNLTSCGVHMILFTTGRGTPAGAPVPTVKISTNHALTERKKNWIDFDASPLIDGYDMDKMSDELIDYITEVASGRECANERNNCRGISIFKDGVTL